MLFLCLIICLSLCILFLILSHNCALHLSLFLQATCNVSKAPWFYFYHRCQEGHPNWRYLWGGRPLNSLWWSILCAKIVIFGLPVWYKVTYLPFSLHFNTLSWWILFFLYTFNWRSADILHTSCCCWFLETYYTGGKIGSNIWDKSPSFSACGIDTSNEAVTADPRVLCSAFSVCVCVCVW